MAKRVRTHRGRFIDLEEIKIKNQEAVAVGNMNVNARGDQIDEYGKVIKSRDAIARDHNRTFKSATNTKASVISAFEDDDDDIVELKDDPKAIERNAKKGRPTTQNSSASKPAAPAPKSAAKDGKADSGKGTSQTDLDD